MPMRLIIGARRCILDTMSRGSVEQSTLDVKFFSDCSSYSTYELIIDYNGRTFVVKYSTSAPSLPPYSDLHGIMVGDTLPQLRQQMTAHIRHINHSQAGNGDWFFILNNRYGANDSVMSTVNDVVAASDTSSRKMQVLDYEALVDKSEGQQIGTSFIESHFQALEASLQSGLITELAMTPTGPIEVKPFGDTPLHFVMFDLSTKSVALHKLIFRKLLLNTFGIVHFNLESQGTDTALGSLIALHEKLARSKQFWADTNDTGAMKVVYVERPVRKQVPKILQRLSLPALSISLPEPCLFSSFIVASPELPERLSMQRISVPAMAPMPQLRVLAFTWNVSGFCPGLGQWLPEWEELFNTDRHPDIICVGLQEVVEMKTKGITGKILQKMGIKSEKDWVGFIVQSINRVNPQYHLMATDDCLGVLSMVFVHVSVQMSIQFIGTEQVRDGWHGLIGSKASLIISIAFNGSIIRFCTTHLESGDCPTKRIEAIEKLYWSYCNTHQSDVFILFGDMNLRVHANKFEYDVIMKDRRLDNPNVDFMQLLRFDERNNGMQDTLLRNFFEGPIEFPPTYRFVRCDKGPIYCDKRMASWYSLMTSGRTECFFGRPPVRILQPSTRGTVAST